MARILIGTVVSDKANKTIVVRVQTRKTHPLYRKQYMTSKKFAAHDEKNEAAIGDRVAIIEIRPVSATKRFSLDRIVERPALREEELAAVNSDDTGKKPTKIKSEDAENGKPIAKSKSKPAVSKATKKDES